MQMRIEKENIKRNKGLFTAVIVLVCTSVLYFGVSFYFTQHFFLQTYVNEQNVSNKNEQEMDVIYQKKMQNYKLTVVDKDGEKEIISGKDIGLEYKKGAEWKSAIKKQNAFLWPRMFWEKQNIDVSIDSTYDEQKFQSAIRSLKLMKVEQVPSKSAIPAYDGSEFVIQKEEFGTIVDVETLIGEIKESIKQLKNTLDLKENNCYKEPLYTTDSKEVKEDCQKMNQYCKANITYQMGEPIVVNKDLIHTWLAVDENMNVSIDENIVKTWLREFGDQYDTVGTTRNYTMITGKAATVTGGTYGWSIDEDLELPILLAAIENAQTVEKEPAYYVGETAVIHAMPDWGNTYVDVDLSEQYLRYVVDGAVALETAIISGETIPEKITPEGVYRIEEKATDEVLVGEILPGTTEPSYRTRVSYWMRITWDTGVGLHDAVWQSAFGGSLNQIPGIGSHGCINMPYGQAEALYSMIAEGTPVVVHY